MALYKFRIVIKFRIIIVQM